VINSLTVTYSDPIYGCTDENACNFDGSANTDDGSCWNPTEGCDCEYPEGSVIDECGVCAGEGIPIDNCDCSGNVNDQCGVCGGDDDCVDCNDVPNGTAYVDNCGICVPENNLSCQIACDGEWYNDESAPVYDECNICGGDGIPSGDCDCDGNVVDECGVCDGNGIPSGDCDCDGNLPTDFCFDWDGDGLGAGSSENICPQDAQESWVPDCSDVNDFSNCLENHWDDCGLCGYENECSGEMNGPDCIGTFIGSIFDCTGTCYGFAEELTYCLDEDNDTFGDPLSATIFCDAYVEVEWIEDCDDMDDTVDCISNLVDDQGNCCDNFIDDCGVCDSDNASCVMGCPDSQASNYYCLMYLCENGLPPDTLEDDGSCTYYFEGHVSYYSNLEPINGVTIQFTGITQSGIDTTISIMTDDNGDFNYDDLPLGTFECTPLFNDYSFDGISSADASDIALHLIGEQPFSYSHSMDAADVSLDSMVTSVDPSRVARYLVESIEQMNGEDLTWEFDPPFISITDVTQTEFAAFQGIKLGDVNGGWSSLSSNLTRMEPYGSVKIDIESQNETHLPLYYSGEKVLLKGIDLNIQYDPDKISNIDFYLDETNINLNNYTIVKNNLEGIFKMVIYAHDIPHTFKGSLGELNINSQLDTGEETIIAIQKLWINDILTDAGFTIDNQDQVTSQIVLQNNSHLQQFNLMGNYPNPFNPSTIISWYQPEADNFIIRVFDIKGQFSENIFDGFLNEGHQSVLWTPKNLPSGIYMYTISSPTQTLSGKMVYIK
jgi:hypothetical protein